MQHNKTHVDRRACGRANSRPHTHTRDRTSHSNTRSRVLTWNPDMTGVSGLCHKTMNNTRPKWQNPDIMVIYWNSNVNILIFWDTDFLLSLAVSSNHQNENKNTSEGVYFTCNESKIYEIVTFWNFFTIFNFFNVDLGSGTVLWHKLILFHFSHAARLRRCICCSLHSGKKLPQSITGDFQLIIRSPARSTNKSHVCTMGFRMALEICYSEFI